MTNYFAGPGGSNANNGTTWALRKLTISAALTTAGASNTVIAGPGTYREAVTFAAASQTLIADTSGTLTDGIGGVARITGSDNDQTPTRSNGVTFNGKTGCTLRGFRIDLTSAEAILADSTTGNTIEDCLVDCCAKGIGANGSINTLTVRRTVVQFVNDFGIGMFNGSSNPNSGCLYQNVLFLVCRAGGIFDNNTGGVTVQGCTILGGFFGIQVTAMAVGQALTVKASVIAACDTALTADTSGHIVDGGDNTVVLNNTNTINVTIAGTGNAYYPLFAGPSLTNGSYLTPIQAGELFSASALAAIAETTTPATDLFGVSRPATPSRGAFQYVAGRRPIDSGSPRGRQQ